MAFLTLVRFSKALSSPAQRVKALYRIDLIKRLAQ
jgi:hypothetical protein